MPLQINDKITTRILIRLTYFVFAPTPTSFSLNGYFVFMKDKNLKVLLQAFEFFHSKSTNLIHFGSYQFIQRQFK